jgi:hypothetical protein
MQRMVEVIVCQPVLLWIGGELEQVIGTASHQHGALWGKHHGQHVHQGSRMCAQGLEFLFGGRIMGQELPGHVARADGKRVRESGRWPLTQDGLCASTSTIHDQQRGWWHGRKSRPAIIQGCLGLPGNQHRGNAQRDANQVDDSVLPERFLD